MDLLKRRNVDAVRSCSPWIVSCLAFSILAKHVSSDPSDVMEIPVNSLKHFDTVETVDRKSKFHLVGGFKVADGREPQGQDD